jgi:hypothetical protein
MLKKTTSIIIIISVVMGTFIYSEAQLHLTQEERNYIAEAGVLRAISVNGAAPIQYTDTKGEIQGISKRVLPEGIDEGNAVV